MSEASETLEARPRRRWWPRVLAGLGAVVVILAVPLVASVSQARSRIEAIRSQVKVDRQRERERIASLRRPVFRGEPIEESATPRYGGPAAANYIAAARAELARLREAVRCTRLDELGEQATFARQLDYDDAAEEVAENLDRARRGADYTETCQSDGMCVGASMFIDNVAHVASVAASRLCPSGGELEKLDHDLEVLATIAPSAETMLERARLEQLEAALEGYLYVELSTVEEYLPRSLVIADSLAEIDRVFTDAIRTSKADRPEPRRHERVWSPWVGAAEIVDHAVDGQVWLAFARTAVRLERYYEKEGHYPKDGGGLLLPDPTERSKPLLYESDGQRYRLTGRHPTVSLERPARR